MLRSMTGFGSKEAEVAPWGKICVELRSSNHKFLETVFHLPDGLLSLEDRVKKEIETKIKRGRVVGKLNIVAGYAQNVFINKGALKNYLSALETIKKQFALKDEISINTLLQLPGVLATAENRILRHRVWSRLKILVNQALDNLVSSRQKEGRALCRYLKTRAEALKTNLGIIRARFKKAIRLKLSKINTDEERSSFLKDTDITEELERLTFHVRHFKTRLTKCGPVGKELDFIAQEMQREANTISAKSCDAAISAGAVQIKSQIEKIREQVQNIE